MLFLGCGDLINPFRATAAGTSQKEGLHIHINDDNLSVIARNILILKIATGPDFDPDTHMDISYVWDVWYNAIWPQSTLKRFLKDIRELLDEPLPQNIIIPNCESKLKLESIWKEWLCMVETVTVSDVLANRYAQEQYFRYFYDFSYITIIHVQ